MSPPGLRVAVGLIAGMGLCACSTLYLPVEVRLAAPIGLSPDESLALFSKNARALGCEVEWLWPGPLGLLTYEPCECYSPPDRVEQSAFASELRAWQSRGLFVTAPFWVEDEGGLVAVVCYHASRGEHELQVQLVREAYEEATSEADQVPWGEPCNSE